MNQQIHDLAVKICNFIRSQVRHLPFNDDQKLQITMASTATASAIFIEAMAELTKEPVEQIEQEFNQAVHAILTRRVVGKWKQ